MPQLAAIIFATISLLKLSETSPVAFNGISPNDPNCLSDFPIPEERFHCLACTDDITSTALYSDQRWAASDASDALAYACTFYVVGDRSSLFGALTGNFIGAVSHYLWNGPDNYDCSSVGVNSCDVGVSCANTWYPAAAHILTSFSNIHNYFTNQFIGIDGAETSIISDLSSFTSTFSPQSPPDDQRQIIVDILDSFGIFFGIFSAFSWNKILKDIPFFTASNDAKNNHGWFKDSSNAIVNSGITIAKDQIPTLQAAQNDLSMLLKSMVDGIRNTTDAYLKHIFSGDEDANIELQALVSDGKWLSTTSAIDPSIFDFQGTLNTLLYGQMIPAAWQRSPGVHPVVIWANGDLVNPYTDYTSPNDLFPKISDTDAQGSRITYNAITLWVLDIHDCVLAPPVRGNPLNICSFTEPAALRPLPGFDALGGKWGGVELSDMMLSSFFGYETNGNKNGYVMPAGSTRIGPGPNDFGDYAYQAGLQTPGFFNIPVCTINDVEKNFRKMPNPSMGERCEFWPCCA